MPSSSSSSIFAAGTTGRKDVCKADFTFLLTYTGTSPPNQRVCYAQFFCWQGQPSFANISGPHTNSNVDGIIRTFLSHYRSVNFERIFCVFNSSQNEQKKFCPSRLGQKSRFSSLFSGRIEETKYTFRNQLTFSSCIFMHKYMNSKMPPIQINTVISALPIVCGTGHTSISITLICLHITLQMF